MGRKEGPGDQMTAILNATIAAPGTYYGLPFMSADPKQRFWPQHNNIEAVFTYGSGGTTVDVYLQASHDGGANWKDIGHFAQIAKATVRDIWRTNAGDSVLDPDQQFAPPLSWWRARYNVIGNYAGTSLQVTAIGADLVQAGVGL